MFMMGRRKKGYLSSGGGNELQPPWVISRSLNPGDVPYWRTEPGCVWLRDIFVPFYDALSPEEQLAYCDRWNAPPGWITLFLHPDLDEVAADADAEASGEFVRPLNYRKIFLGESG
jgi:hypothetical protein